MDKIGFEPNCFLPLFKPHNEQSSHSHLWALWLCLPKDRSNFSTSAEKVETKLPGTQFCRDMDSSIAITISTRAFNFIKPILQLGVYVWA